MTMKIYWTCEKKGAWQWVDTRNEQKSFPAPSSISGEVNLDPNPDYWYQCITAVFPNVTYGRAYLRYHQVNGVDHVQALVDARNQWDDLGVDSEATSITDKKGAEGGLMLTVSLPRK
jgi:hypothetical protein